jgi:hypothetical protein
MSGGDDDSQDDAPPDEPPPPDLSGPKIDLFPNSVLQPIADAGTAKTATATATATVTATTTATATNDPNVVRVPGWLGGHDLRIPGPFEFPAPAVEERDDNRAQWLGPAYEGLAYPPTDVESEFPDHITAEAALSLLPAALIGALAKPAVDYIYKLIDLIPEALRRPFEKAFGLMIDNAMSAVDALTTPLVDASVDKFYGDGKNLPPSANIPIRAYSQTEFSCGETAAATILKWAGVPTSLEDPDTQFPVNGTSALVDEEFRRRGLTLVSGPGDLNKLKAFLANNYPVLVSIGWESGGGHLCVASGYDNATHTITLVNYDAEGGVVKVDENDFAKNWARHLYYMSAVLPRRDARLDEVAQAGDLRRPTPIYEGLTLSDFYVSPESKVFVEGAYRFVTDWTDITMRVNFDQSEEGLARQFGGSLAIQQKLATGWFLGLTVEKVSLRGQNDDWSSFSTAPISIYGSLKAPGFELKAGAEHGGFQASLVADLGHFIAGLGIAVNVSVDPDQGYRIYGTLSFNA